MFVLLSNCVPTSCSYIVRYISPLYSNLILYKMILLSQHLQSNFEVKSGWYSLRKMASLSIIQNETLAFLEDNFPDFVDYVPKEVLEFGLPDHTMSIFAVLYIGFLMVISLTGNSLMVFLYAR